MERSKELMSSTCRVAMAGLLHDIGKFAQRAGLPVEELNGNKAVYCPVYKGRYSHLHAAWSAMAVDAIENSIPDIRQGDTSPFSSWGDRERRDDSMINAAAMHHKPETPLQRIIATADRLASGFERTSFEEYNQADEGLESLGEKQVNHLRARMWSILETVTMDGKNFKKAQHRHLLQPLSPENLFPGSIEEVEPTDDGRAKKEYLFLWEGFVEGLNRIPQAHRGSLPLWLDHFDSLMQTFTHAIPSATAAKKPSGGFMSVPADVSLYDHSKTTAALAVAMWRFHEARGTVDTAFSEEWRHSWDTLGTDEFLLIQGDFFGIQSFIFADGEKTKRAAKRLRGRSFSVSLLTELAALKVLEVFELPITSQVINAAGRFLIVAPALADAQERLEAVRRTLDSWFLQHTFGQSGVGLASTGAGRKDFRKACFGGLMARLFADLERRKRSQFSLCGSNPPPPIFSKVDYSKHGACSVDGRVPATVSLQNWDGDQEEWVCGLCADQLAMGTSLVKKERLLITLESVNKDSLDLDYFGFCVTFTGKEAESGRFGALAQGGKLLRAWDYGLPDPAQGNKALWNGYAWRSMAGYIPSSDTGDILEFSEIAKSSIMGDSQGKTIGVNALGILKGDVDNLGIIFHQALQEPTFARMAALSRQVNAFFTIWLPWICAKRFPNTYTVFAGGDDFFLLGPWLEQIHLAEAMREAFGRYGLNPDVHFSAGIVMTKPSIPVPSLGLMANNALEQAKKYEGKNAVTCWNRTVDWKDFSEMLAAEKELTRIAKKYELSTGYLYGLLHLCDKAESSEIRPEDAIWRSWFVYRTWRQVLDRLKKMDEKERKEIYKREFAEQIGSHIEQWKGNYKISLFTCYYQRRELS